MGSMRPGDIPARPSKLRCLPADTMRRCLRRWDALLPLIGAMPEEQILAELDRRDLVAEHLAYLAFALPEREAIWWACQCVGRDPGSETSPDHRDALATAERWVRRADAGLQVDCARLARAIGRDHATGHVARAVCATAPSYPHNIMASRHVDDAVRMAGATGRAGADTMLRSFVVSAMNIAGGGAGRLLS
ncbi:MAG: hypothetical protein INR65_00115 [Gluconacetobacter diazotrophicus]|nr:hypothetical protein [Gluconacetobacter diazotrophicus]